MNPTAERARRRELASEALIRAGHALLDPTADSTVAAAIYAALALMHIAAMNPALGDRAVAVVERVVEGRAQ